jgi:hypothetical protein
MQRSSFLRALSLCLGVLVGCGADDPSMAFPEDDAAVGEDGAVVEMDAGELPSFDVPGIDRGTPTLDVGIDRGGPVDTGSSTDRGTTPVDTGVISTDHGSPVACPSSCGSDVDCNPCRTSSDPDTVRYCCLSGLCISMTGVCPSGMPMGGPDGGGGGGDGGADGGLPGADASGGTDASGGGPG